MTNPRILDSEDEDGARERQTRSSTRSKQTPHPAPSRSSSPPRSRRPAQPSEKQREKEKRAQDTQSAKVAHLEKQLVKLKQRNGQMALALADVAAEKAPPEEEEDMDRPISQFDQSFFSNGVYTVETPAPRRLRKSKSNADKPIPMPMPRVPLQTRDKNISGADEFDDQHNSTSTDDENESPLSSSRRSIPSTATRKRARTSSPSGPPRNRQRRSGAATTPVASLPAAQFVDGKAPAKARTSRRDFQAAPARLLASAQYKWELNIWSVRAFPEFDMQEKWLQDIWGEVQAEGGERMQLTHRMGAMIRSYGTHARGTVVQKVQVLVDGTYDFTGEEEDVRSTVKDLLKDDVFHYADPTALTGFAKNPIVLKSLRSVFFPNKRGRAIKYNEFFNPIRIPTLALIFAVIEYCISRYSTGTYDAAASFDETHHKSRYEAHLKSLEDWDALLPAKTLEFRQNLHDECRKKCGAPMIYAAGGLSEERKTRLLAELEAM